MIDRIRLYFWLIFVSVCNIFCDLKDDSALQYYFYLGDYIGLRDHGSLSWSKIKNCKNYKDVAEKIMPLYIKSFPDFLFYVDENVHKVDEPLKIDEFTETSTILIVGKKNYYISRDRDITLVKDISEEVTKLEEEFKVGYYMTEGQLLKKLASYTKIKDKITLDLDTYLKTVKIVTGIHLNKLEDDDVQKGYIKFKDGTSLECSDRNIEKFFPKIKSIHSKIKTDSVMYNSLFYFLYFGGEIEVISGEGGTEKVEKMVNLDVKDTEGRIKKYNDLKNEKLHFNFDNRPISYNLIFPEYDSFISFCIRKQSMSTGKVIKLVIPKDFLGDDNGKTAGVNFIFKLFDIDKSDLFDDNIKFINDDYRIKIKRDKKLSIDKSPGYDYLNDFGVCDGSDESRKQDDHKIPDPNDKKCFGRCGCCCFQ